MIGYKAAYDYKCLNQSYMVGQEYKMDEKPIVCKKGFHYCKDIKGIFEYYSMGYKTNVFEIEDLNHTETAADDNVFYMYTKYATNHIKIVRELSDFELVEKLKLYALIWEDANKNKILTYKTLNGFWITKVFDEANSCIYYADSFGKIKKINVSETGKKIYFDVYKENHEITYHANKSVNLCHLNSDFEHIQHQMFDLYNIKFSKTQKVASH
jgi:hypothetical protein